MLLLVAIQERGHYFVFHKALCIQCLEMVMAYDFRAFMGTGRTTHKSCQDPVFSWPCPVPQLHLTLSLLILFFHSLCLPVAPWFWAPVDQLLKQLPFSLIYYTHRVDSTEGIVTCQCFHLETVLVSCGCWKKKKMVPWNGRNVFSYSSGGYNSNINNIDQKQDIGRATLLLEALG